MMLRNSLSLITALVAVLTSAGAWAGDAEAGKGLYPVCTACHGPAGQGNQAMNAPKLAGQEGWYIKRQLAAYRDGLRGTAPGDTYGMQMRPMAMAVGNPDAEANLIAYIESLPVTDSAPTVSGDVAAGQAGYAVCAACHGQKAEGVEALGGPRLAGLDDWYLVRQITPHPPGLRGNDPKDTHGMQMKPMAATLATEKAVNDVVAYINTLK